MQKLILWFIQSMLGWKYPFGVNLVLKIKTVRLFLNLLPELIRIWRIQWRCSFFFCFLLELPFLGKFCLNIPIKLKFGT